MGVNGLMSIIGDYPNASKTMLIKEMASRHKDPVLVVDGNNFLTWLYGKHIWIYGGQWLQFKEDLERFVENLKAIGIKPVFFFDGTICENKLEKRAMRKMENYKKIDTLFQQISESGRVEDIKYNDISPGTKLMARLALIELGVEMYQTDKDVEADNYIAKYANENKAVFAILSDDTDFIIFDTKPLLSVNKLNLEKMETNRYDRFSLAKGLNLSIEQLPLFACLMGNDYFSFDDLKSFHRKMVKKERPFSKAKAKHVGRLIKVEQWTGNVNDKRELKSIVGRVFHSVSDLKICVLKNGLESYEINNEASLLKLCVPVSDEFEKAAHERHHKGLNICIYNLLCKKEYGSSEVFENEPMLASALVYREIRQRCYGVLFNCSENPDNLKSTVIKERCWYINEDMTPNDLNIPEDIYPLELRNTNEKIKVDDLWFNSSEEKKFEIFREILQIPMELQLLMRLREDQLTLSCILNFLIRGKESVPLLEPLDVAVFVAQAVWKQNTNLKDPPLIAEALNLSTLFVSGIEAVLMALETCGFPESYKYAMPWKFFDGKIFHFLYNKAKTSPTVRDLCENSDEIKEKFYELLPLVTNGTIYHPDNYEWVKVLQDFLI